MIYVGVDLFFFSLLAHFEVGYRAGWWFSCLFLPPPRFVACLSGIIFLSIVAVP